MSNSVAEGSGVELAGQVLIVGGGKMGEAILAGLLRQSLTPDRIGVVERYAERADHLVRTYGIDVASLEELLPEAQVVVLATKPQDVEATLAQIRPHAHADQLFISVAAGISTTQLEAGLPPGAAVVRCMPNTPALVDEAITAVAPGTNASAAQTAIAQALLSAVGAVVRVQESQLDAVTALSGSGPAYFFYIVEAMIDAGVLLGLPRALATQLVVQTALGSAVMLRDLGQHPVALREAVTSPGGTTIAALRELENHAVRGAVISALEAAHDRSRELGRS